MEGGREREREGGEGIRPEMLAIDGYTEAHAHAQHARTRMSSLIEVLVGPWPSSSPLSSPPGTAFEEVMVVVVVVAVAVVDDDEEEEAPAPASTRASRLFTSSMPTSICRTHSSFSPR